MNGYIDCKTSTATVEKYMIAFGELERGFKRKTYGPF
jgi:hypothetical protein